jgi:3-phosphoshikimate 1-carboxyvinyltransferase
MSRFEFAGPIPASKSILNRALIAQSYEQNFIIEGDSECDDVRAMKQGLKVFANIRSSQSQSAQVIHCSEAGTVLRFLIGRVSREKGLFRLTGSSRLLSRPHQEMAEILKQLGVPVKFQPDQIEIDSKGWQPRSDIIKISRRTSSQFASSILLNSWDLPFDLKLEIEAGVSDSYLELTFDLLKQWGLQIEKMSNHWIIPRAQKLKPQRFTAELDMSSAFPIAVLGALLGQSEIQNWSDRSSQPDQAFVEILQKMNVLVKLTSTGSLQIEKSQIHAADVDLSQTPDLFPVLAVLCSFAKGKSRLFGAPHLKFKESNRIEKTAQLLSLAGVVVQETDDGLIIEGERPRNIPKPFEFDPDEDHRMAMAAGVLRLMGYAVQILHPQVVSKSFPEFWNIINTPQPDQLVTSSRGQSL